MKKIIFAVLSLWLTACSCIAENKHVNTNNVINTIGEYKDVSGVQVISVGKLILGLGKFAAKLSVDSEEEKAALEILNCIDKVVVINYEDAAEAQKNELNARFSDLFNQAETILEVKEDGATVKIYGTSVNEGESIDDLMIFIPEEYTLICVLGSISADKVGELIKIANE